MFGILNLWRVEKFLRKEFWKYHHPAVDDPFRECFHFYAIAFYLVMVMKKLPDGLKMVPFVKFSRTDGLRFDQDKIYMIAHLNSDYFLPRINTMLISGRAGIRENARGECRHYNQIESEQAFLQKTYMGLDNSNDYRLLECIYKYCDIPKYSMYTSNFVCFNDAVLLEVDRKPFIVDKVELSQTDI